MVSVCIATRLRPLNGAGYFMPFMPLRTIPKSGFEESVTLVALYQRLERKSLLFANAD